MRNYDVSFVYIVTMENNISYSKHDISIIKNFIITRSSATSHLTIIAERMLYYDCYFFSDFSHLSWR